MTIEIRIKAIESRCARVGWTLHRLCDEAVEDIPGTAQPRPVAYALVNNWLNNRHSPTERKAGPVLRGLERTLVAREREVFFSLAPLFLPPEMVADAAACHGFDLSLLDDAPCGVAADAGAAGGIASSVSPALAEEGATG